MKKYFFLALLFTTTSVSGQFTFDIGISAIASNTLKQNFSYEDVNWGTTYEYSEMNMLGAGILIYPRYLFAEVGTVVLGIGSPSNIALDTYFQSLGVIDANLTLDLVGGGLNILNDSEDFGYYVGVGYGITFLIENSPGYYGSSGDKEDLYKNIDIVEYDGSPSEYKRFHNGMTKSIFVHAGVGSIKILGSNLGFRVGYKPCLGKNCMSYFTTSIFLNLE